MPLDVIILQQQFRCAQRALGAAEVEIAHQSLVVLIFGDAVALAFLEHQALLEQDLLPGVVEQFVRFGYLLADIERQLLALQIELAFRHVCLLYLPPVLSPVPDIPAHAEADGIIIHPFIAEKINPGAGIMPGGIGGQLGEVARTSRSGAVFPGPAEQFQVAHFRPPGQGFVQEIVQHSRLLRGRRQVERLHRHRAGSIEGEAKLG